MRETISKLFFGITLLLWAALMYSLTWDPDDQLLRLYFFYSSWGTFTEGFFLR